MPALKPAYPLAADAYLRIGLTSGIADLVCGAQLSAVLDDLRTPDDGVVLGAGGMFTVREADGCHVQYEPLHRSGWRRACTARRFLFTLYVGAVAKPQGIVTHQQMTERAMRMGGSLHGLTDGSAVNTFHGVIAARWTPAANKEAVR
ncbi:hypothetical protein ACFZAM_32025 [Streptomyces sp. NPDC008079]|uniref:hypothetical protein n=1 Tax=Streptomyces sp. NPDC008079 TaxID=3364806 RepID=UPI0036F187DD